MIKIGSAIVFAIFTLVIACSTSEKTGQAEVQKPVGGKIAWTRFDEGMNNVSDGNKFVLAYFWRDG